MATKEILRPTETESLFSTFAIKRTSPKVDVSKTNQLTDHLKSFMQAQMTDLTRDLAKTKVTPVKKTAHIAKSMSELDVRRHIDEWTRKQAFSLPRTMNITIPLTAGTVVSPPYDHVWTDSQGSGNPGMAFKENGKMFSMTTTDGSSGGGVAFDMSSPVPALVGVTPMAPFNWGWLAFATFPSLLNRGGLGIRVFENGSMLLDRTSTLWSITWAPMGSDSGSGMFADMKTTVPNNDPWFFGQLPMAPVAFNMIPGRNYQVWVWVWQVTKIIDNPFDSLFMSSITCTVPSFTVDAGPPLAIH